MYEWHCQVHKNNSNRGPISTFPPNKVKVKFINRSHKTITRKYKRKLEAYGYKPESLKSKTVLTPQPTKP